MFLLPSVTPGHGGQNPQGEDCKICEFVSTDALLALRKVQKSETQMTIDNLHQLNYVLAMLIFFYLVGMHICVYRVYKCSIIKLHLIIIS